MIIVEIERKIWQYVRGVSPRAHALVWPKRRVLKYIISGGTAAAVNLFLLYFFTGILGVWYVVSSVLAFLLAFLVSFIFQKFWTFEDRATDGVHAQAAAYLLVALLNLCLNTFLVYFFVEFFGINYLAAQVIAGVLIACESFFVYRRFIFKRPAVSV